MGALAVIFPSVAQRSERTHDEDATQAVDANRVIAERRGRPERRSDRETHAAIPADIATSGMTLRGWVLLKLIGVATVSTSLGL